MTLIDIIVDNEYEKGVDGNKRKNELETEHRSYRNKQEQKEIIETTKWP